MRFLKTENIPLLCDKRYYSLWLFQSNRLLSRVISSKIDAKSQEQGFEQSRLPEFTPEESAEIMGAFDFLGINHYSTKMVYPEVGSIDEVSYFLDDDAADYQDSNWYT